MNETTQKTEALRAFTSELKELEAKYGFQIPPKILYPQQPLFTFCLHTAIHSMLVSDNSASMEASLDHLRNAKRLIAEAEKILLSALEDEKEAG